MPMCKHPINTRVSTSFLDAYTNIMSRFKIWKNRIPYSMPLWLLPTPFETGSLLELSSLAVEIESR